MTIWFYLLIIVIIILIVKIFIMKKEIKHIEKTLSFILKSDTNKLITVESNDKELKKLARNLNKNLVIIRKLKVDYDKKNQDLRRSITNISHDLRTPLTAIRGYLDLINFKNLSKEQLKYLQIIIKKTDDLTKLTEQLFDYSKSLDNIQEIKKEKICINNALEDILSDFYGLFQEYNIVPKIFICKNKVTKFLDKNMLKRIFENIISNVLKYNEGDFTVKLKDNGEIIFSNKTKKIDYISVEKIFDRYYTILNAKKSNGIGLSIAKQLVELNNGSIKANYKNEILSIKIIFP